VEGSPVLALQASGSPRVPGRVTLSPLVSRDEKKKTLSRRLLSRGGSLSFFLGASPLLHLTRRETHTKKEKQNRRAFLRHADPRACSPRLAKHSPTSLVTLALAPQLLAPRNWCHVALRAPRGVECRGGTGTAPSAPSGIRKPPPSQGHHGPPIGLQRHPFRHRLVKLLHALELSIIFDSSRAPSLRTSGKFLHGNVEGISISNYVFLISQCSSF
jgi:hypothetical protein